MSDKENTEESSFWDNASDRLGAMAYRAVDGLAEGQDALQILGGATSALLNTDTHKQYEARLKNKAEAESLALEDARNQHELNALKLQTYKNDAEVRQAQREKFSIDMRNYDEIKASEDKARIAQNDRVYQENQYSVIKKNMTNRLASNPAWQGLNEKERESVIDSPQFKANLEATFWVRELLTSRNNPEAWERTKRKIELDGGNVIDDGKGNFSVKYNGMNIPLNEDSVGKIHKFSEDKLNEEIEIRGLLSYNSTKGNIMGKVVSERTTALMPFFGGSMKVANDFFKSSMSSLSENHHFIHFLNKTFDDNNSAILDDEEKMAELSKALPMLNRVGWGVKMSPSGDVRDAIFYELENNKKQLSYVEFGQYLKDNDVAGKQYDLQYQTIKKDYENKAKLQIAKNMNDAEKINTQDIPASKKLFNAYGSRVYDLTNGEKEKFAEYNNKFNIEIEQDGVLDFMKDTKKSPDEKYTLMKALDTKWINDLDGLGIDSDDFPSVYAPHILNYDIAKMQAEFLTLDKDKKILKDLVAKENADAKNKDFELADDAYQQMVHNIMNPNSPPNFEPISMSKAPRSEKLDKYNNTANKLDKLNKKLKEKKDSLKKMLGKINLNKKAK